MKSHFLTGVLAVSWVLLPSCSSLPSIEDCNNVGLHARVFEGTVIDVRPTRVAVSHEDKELGRTVGSLTGFGLGQLLGGGRGRVMAAYGGSALGSLAGHATASSLAQREGQRLTIRTSSGRTYTVVQPVCRETGRITVGSSGKLEMGNGTSRFIPKDR